MKNKKVITSLLCVILSASCVTMARPVSSTISPMPKPTAIRESTDNVVPSQARETQDTKAIDPYQDVRSEDLHKYGSLGETLIKTLWFDSITIWSSEDKEIAQNVLSMGMNPGLGIRDLHREDITGKGVTIGIIDQNMNINHPEFQGKIVKYHDMGAKLPTGEVSMHGPAVTSLLVGDAIGTAPGASIYYVAVPSWLLDTKYYADALDWMVNENEKLPEGKKIRVISVSAAPSGGWSEYTENQATWDSAYQRATEAGILVLDCTLEHGYTNPCTYDLNDPDNVAKCIPNYAGSGDIPHKRINIPTNRTTAIENKVFGTLHYGYQYTGIGGLSWTTPYLAGILAMGWQVNPRLSNSEILDILFVSGFVNESSARIIDPRNFIHRVQITDK